MQLFAHSRTEAGIARLRAAKEEERRQRGMAERKASLELQIAELSRELADISEPVVIKSEYRRIEERACRVFRVTTFALKSNRRHRRLAAARHFIMYWAMRRTLLSSTQIGRLLGGRDHTTVLHGRDAYREKRGKAGRNLRDIR